MILFRPEHVAPILEGRKTQTRRLGNKRWNEGAIHQCSTRLFDPAAIFARVRILQVWRHQLHDMTHPMVMAEGFDSHLEFRRAFFEINPGLKGDPMVWAVRFELVRP